MARNGRIQVRGLRRTGVRRRGDWRRRQRQRSGKERRRRRTAAGERETGSAMGRGCWQLAKTEEQHAAQIGRGQRLTGNENGKNEE